MWDSGKNKQTDKLQKLQNRAGRKILKINPYSRTSNKNIHTILGWNFLISRRTKHLLQLVFKALNEIAPPYLTELFKIKENVYCLRSDYNINITRPRNNYYKRM